jgi:CubicO group peptidase (beta-lactamase class C family)
LIGGQVAAGYEAVQDDFAALMAEPGEVAASFSAYVEGVPVVDLSGGESRENTVQVIFSGTKGLVATCLLVLIDRGLLDLDRPVSAYWPEFGQSEKTGVLVRHVVSHQAGLPAVDPPPVDGEVLDPVRMEDRLARQPTLWPPGSAITYHALTYGWLCDGLIRHVDGRSVGRFFAEEVAGPLNLDAWIGLPEHVYGRVAMMRRAPDYQVNVGEAGDAERQLLTRVYAGGGLSGRDFPWNDRAYLHAEIPGVNAVASARAMARLYGCLALGGQIDGVRLLKPETLRLGVMPLGVGPDRLTGYPDAFSAGFELQSERKWYGPPDVAFGHSGAGGSVHGAWPDLRTGFSYSMTLMRRDDRDGRAQRLLRSLYTACRIVGQTQEEARRA